MKVTFLVVWGLYSLLFFGSAPWLPDLVGDPGKEMSRGAYLALMGGIHVFAPWLVAFGCLALIRKGIGGVNIPNAEYWFSGERRDQSLIRMEPFMQGMGLWVLQLLALQHASLIWNQLGMAPRLGIGFHLAGVGIFVAGTFLWTWGVMRAFPKPPDELQMAAAGPRRPRRPGA